MLWWILVFFVLALVAAALGFGGFAASFAGIAEVLFYVFLVLFAISIVVSLFRRRSATPI